MGAGLSIAPKNKNDRAGKPGTGDDKRVGGGAFATNGTLPPPPVGQENVAASFAGESWSLHASLNWGRVADVDLHLYTPTAHISWENLSADGFTLNHDAHRRCEESPGPPEIITGNGRFGTYVISSDLFGDCDDMGQPPLTFEATVTVGEEAIMINGARYEPGQTFTPQDGLPFIVGRPPFEIVRETEPDSGIFKTVSRLPVFRSESGAGLDETISGGYAFSILLDENLTNTAVDTVTVSSSGSRSPANSNQNPCGTSGASGRA